MTALEARDARGLFSAIWNQYFDCTTPLTFSVDHDGEVFTCHAVFKTACGGFDFSSEIIVVNQKNFVNSVYLEDIPESYLVNKDGPFIKNEPLKENLVGFLKRKVTDHLKETPFYSPENTFFARGIISNAIIYALKVFSDREPYNYKTIGMDESLEKRDINGFLTSFFSRICRKQGKKTSDLRKTYLPDDYKIQLVPEGRRTSVFMSSIDFYYRDEKLGMCIKEAYRPFRDQTNDRIIDVLSNLSVNWEAVALLDVCNHTSKKDANMDKRHKYAFFTDTSFPNRMFFLRKFYGLISALTYNEIFAIKDFIDAGVLNVHELARFMNKYKVFRINISGDHILNTVLINDLLMSVESNRSFQKGNGSRALLNNIFVVDFYLPENKLLLRKDGKEDIERKIIDLMSLLDSLGDVKNHVPLELFTYMVANDICGGETYKSFNGYLTKIAKILCAMERPYFLTSDLEDWINDNFPIEKWKNASQARQSRFFASMEMMTYFFEHNGQEKDNTHILNNCPILLSNSEKMDLLDWLDGKYAFSSNNLFRDVNRSLNILVNNLIRPLGLFLADKESDASFSDNKEYQSLLMTVAIKVMVNQYKIGNKTTFLEFCERLRHMNLNKSKLSATVLCHTSKETAESVLKMFSGYIDQKLIDGGPDGFLGINEMYRTVKMLSPEKRVSRPVNLNVRDVNGELEQFNYLPHERSEY